MRSDMKTTSTSTAAGASSSPSGRAPPRRSNPNPPPRTRRQQEKEKLDSIAEAESFTAAAAPLPQERRRGESRLPLRSSSALTSSLLSLSPHTSSSSSSSNAEVLEVLDLSVAVVAASPPSEGREASPNEVIDVDDFEDDSPLPVAPSPQWNAQHGGLGWRVERPGSKERGGGDSDSRISWSAAGSGIGADAVPGSAVASSDSHPTPESRMTRRRRAPPITPSSPPSALSVLNMKNDTVVEVGGEEDRIRSMASALSRRRLRRRLNNGSASVLPGRGENLEDSHGNEKGSDVAAARQRRRRQQAGKDGGQQLAARLQREESKSQEEKDAEMARRLQSEEDNDVARWEAAGGPSLLLGSDAGEGSEDAGELADVWADLILRASSLGENANINGNSSSSSSGNSSARARSGQIGPAGLGAYANGGARRAGRAAGGGGGGAGASGSSSGASGISAGAVARQRRQQSSENGPSRAAGEGIQLAHMISHIMAGGQSRLGQIFAGRQQRGGGEGGRQGMAGAFGSSMALMRRELTPSDYQSLLALGEFARVLAVFASKYFYGHVILSAVV